MNFSIFRIRHKWWHFFFTSWISSDLSYEKEMDVHKFWCSRCKDYWYVADYNNKDKNEISK